MNAAKVISKNYQIEQGVIEYRAKAETGNEIRIVVREDKEDIGRTQLAYSSSYAGAEHAIAA